MPERIYKLQPDRTVFLRGFDHFGAAAAVHNATADSFNVSGVFRDPADFAVVVLYDADNFFEHPTLKYLPDFDFSNLTLTFNLAAENLMPINCRKYPTIDWPYLGVETPNGDRTRVSLAELSTIVAGQDEPASGTLEILTDDLQGFDRLTLWYLNLAFDYIVPGKPSVELDFAGGSAGSQHSVVVRDRPYVYTQQAGDSPAVVVSQLASLINAANDLDAVAEVGAEAHLLKVRARRDDGTSFPVLASGHPAETLFHIQASTVARALAAQINTTDCEAAGAPFNLLATADAGFLTLTTTRGGYDANFVRLYATAKNGRLTAAPSLLELKHGTSNATLRVTLDFSALGLTQVRRLWMTFAPRLTGGDEFTDTEWNAAFTGFQLQGPEERKRLRVAGPASVRIPSTSLDCTYSGQWSLQDGFYHGGVAHTSSAPGATVTVRYHCGQPHSLWVGTALYGSHGTLNGSLDGTPQPALSTSLPSEEPVVTRRRLAALVPPGNHTVVLSSVSAAPVVFNFLEAAVESDVPDPAPPTGFYSPALDYSTDHTYKLPPARIHWIYDRLGFTGPMNEYLGVFWWNQRSRLGGSVPQALLAFSGEFQDGDRVFLHLGNQTLGKSVFPADTPTTIATHFACFVNATQTGVRAEAVGPELTLYSRSAAPAFRFPVSVTMERVLSSTGACTVTGTLETGVMPEWVIDPLIDPPLNAAAAAWHLDFFEQAAARGRTVTAACSMELVHPPDSFAARFHDGQPVRTAVGFASLTSTHCAFVQDTLEYQKRVYGQIAALQQEAGITPDLQFGEFTWWYFSNWTAANPNGGMAYYDAETSAAALAALGRELAHFHGANDDPGLNGGADAAFLAARLHSYVTQLAAHLRGSFPDAVLEVLFPYDVNHPVPAGVHFLGGALNRAVNFPPAWAAKESAGFDRLKVEALDFGAWSRDLDLVFRSLKFPFEQGWPGNSVRVMVPIFRGGYPWHHEVQWAQSLGMNFAHLWAFDHFCLHGPSPSLPGDARSLPQG